MVMHLLLIGFESLALIIGSLATAIVMCWLLWFLFRSVHHPAWAALAIFLLAALACTGHLPASQFLQMALAFAVLGAIPLWTEGRAWRQRAIYDAPRSRPATPGRTARANPIPRPGYGRYPAIVACIGQDREANRAEVRMVAARIWRETCQAQGLRSDLTPSFARRRRLLRAARYAMSGQIPASR
jgi:hypothetical protein